MLYHCLLYHCLIVYTFPTLRANKSTVWSTDKSINPVPQQAQLSNKSTFALLWFESLFPLLVLQHLALLFGHGWDLQTSQLPMTTPAICPNNSFDLRLFFLIWHSNTWLFCLGMDGICKPVDSPWQFLPFVQTTPLIWVSFSSFSTPTTLLIWHSNNSLFCLDMDGILRPAGFPWQPEPLPSSNLSALFLPGPQSCDTINLFGHKLICLLPTICSNNSFDLVCENVCDVTYLCLSHQSEKAVECILVWR